MNCPIDGTPLQMADRQGIEVDYCPQCRGVWLDRGELDKIIERSAAATSRRGRDDDDDDDDDRGERYEGDYRPAKRKRKSLLGELFDF